MKIKNIVYPVSFSTIKDIENYNVDIFVELEDGFSYTMVVGTPKNLLYLMEKDDKNYCEPGIPMIIVKKLTKEIILEAVTAFCDGNAYWFKEYYLSGCFDMNMMDQMIENIKNEIIL